MTDRFDACLPHILHHEGGWASFDAMPQLPQPVSGHGI